MEQIGNLNIFRYEDSMVDVTECNREFGKQSIFLAGPTVRGNQPHLTSWRFEAIEIFKKLNFNGSIILPEFTDKTTSDKGKKWVPLWERNGLIHCDTILFWIPRTRELIGLTTNWELGYWMGRELSKVVYGRPDDAFRIDYCDTMWEAGYLDQIDFGFTKLKQCPKIYNTLEDTIKASIDNKQFHGYKK